MPTTSKTTGTTRQTRIWAGCLIGQGIAGAAWWGCLAAIHSSRDHFKPPGSPDWAILSFWLADLLIFVAGSLLSGVLILRGSRSARPVLWFTTGGVSYASLYCIGLSVLTRSVWLASGMMFLAMGMTLWIASRYEMRERK